jgi:1,3-beta-glucan synthase
MCCKKFGAVLAAIAHAIAVIMLLAFFEVLFFLESWSFSKTILGMLAVIAIQRLIYKVIISLALTREFKADTSNIAWWTGKWYTLGWHTISQPGREFLCKITELGYFAADFILGHVLLFLQLPVLLIPYIDKFHSVMLFWLRPRYVSVVVRFYKYAFANKSSRQIRPPIYSIKQTKLRKRRVIRYSILYFILFFLFVALIVGPIVVGPKVKFNESNDILNELIQPTGFNHNDTVSSQTGTQLQGGATATDGGSSPTSTSEAAAAATTAGTKFRIRI